uniref:Uncharacterized protein n=1 Tax=Anguilla anguilla TaxID=7936 RepID=A0A0E9TP63_ANGAN
MIGSVRTEGLRQEVTEQSVHSRK